MIDCICRIWHLLQLRLADKLFQHSTSTQLGVLLNHQVLLGIADTGGHSTWLRSMSDMPHQKKSENNSASGGSGVMKAKDSKSASRSISTLSIIATLVLVVAVTLQFTPDLLQHYRLLSLQSLYEALLSQIQGKSAAPVVDPANVPQDHACIALTHWLPEITHLPGTQGFSNQWRAHWSEEAQNAVPSCVIRPRNTTEVAHTVTVLKNLYELPFIARARGTGGVVSEPVRFVVRSGGHAVEYGFSSINGGVLVDLELLNFINLDQDSTLVSIGPGARWGEVFDKLDRVGLTAAGGRNARVGVGGLSLGGGLSFISPQVGMVQDNILEYEVVLANGSIVTATQTDHSDLWRALKGGGGNFGIVTSYKIRTFPATKVWSGSVFYVATQRVTNQLLTSLHEFVKPINFDQYAAGPILGFARVKVLGYDVKLVCSHYFYGKPVAWPSVWASFKSIFIVWSRAKIRGYASAAEELVGVALYGKRQHQATLTIKNDLDTIRAFHDLHAQAWKQVEHVQGLSWIVVFQPLTPAIIHHGSTNSLGLESRNASDPLLIALVAVSWTEASNSEVIYEATRNLITSMKQYAIEKGTLDRYLYINYAASWQDVFGSYGEQNRQFLQSVSKKYDEYGFWQTARAGGFKLGLGNEELRAEAFARQEASTGWEYRIHTPPAHEHGPGNIHDHAHGHDHHHHHHH